MKLLLDTHIWLWSLLAPDELTARVRTELASATNEIWLSPISSWEVLLLIERGRLAVDGDPLGFIHDMIDALPTREAAINHAVAIESRRIALVHQDPADRFLAATARVYELTLVTADARLLESSEYAALANE